MGSMAIAFLSGKGGSGKTTLALSMADLLCRCDVKVLLVDCDLSTNGATYFYESKLDDGSKNDKSRLHSFNEMLNGELYQKVESIKIKQNLDFLPSIAGISEQYLDKNEKMYSADNKRNLHSFLEEARFKYDVILFDCQAGYTGLLSILLPLMDIDLFVLEADSISASAMRSLHLKIGNNLGRARLYQVFNKVTKEEFEIYSKIVGTFFTNIGTLLFDWKIRQAFSRSQIPDLENTSAQYSLDLCSVCKIMLLDEVIQKKLEKFSGQLQLRQLEEKQKKTEDQLKKAISRPIRSSMYPIVAFSISIICAVIFIITEDTFKGSSNEILSVIITVLLGLFVVVERLYLQVRENRTERYRYEKDLKNIEKEIRKISQVEKKQKNN